MRFDERERFTALAAAGIVINSDVFHGKESGRMKDKIDLAQKLSTFMEHWQPRTVATFNGNDVMVGKVKGEFVWHKHDDTDDFFFVLNGKLDIELRDRTISLEAGDLYIVPKGVSIGPWRKRSTHTAHRANRHANTGDRATAQPRRLA
jgi:mannose-6-phosphate isomerase-like protein (cupin superfamily)